MENNKYYKPDIEDLRIGYNCEWYGAIGLKHEYMPITMDVKWINIAVNNGIQYFRTEYLTKTNIESLGWKINIEYNHLSRCAFEKDNYYLLLNTRKQIPFIKIIYKDRSKEEDGWIVAPEHFQISIQCPSINELKTIEKLLNIK